MNKQEDGHPLLLDTLRQPFGLCRCLQCFIWCIRLIWSYWGFKQLPLRHYFLSRFQVLYIYDRILFDFEIVVLCASYTQFEGFVLHFWKYPLYQLQFWTILSLHMLAWHRLLVLLPVDVKDFNLDFFILLRARALRTMIQENGLLLTCLHLQALYQCTWWHPQIAERLLRLAKHA